MQDYSLYRITSAKSACKGSAVDSLKLDSAYSQRDRAIKMIKVITSEIQKRVSTLSTNDKMEMYVLQDALVAWLNDFQQYGVSDINLTPTYRRIKEMLLIWGQDGL